MSLLPNLAGQSVAGDGFGRGRGGARSDDVVVIAEELAALWPKYRPANHQIPSNLREFSTGATRLRVAATMSAGRARGGASIESANTMTPIAATSLMRFA